MQIYKQILNRRLKKQNIYITNIIKICHCRFQHMAYFNFVLNNTSISSFAAWLSERFDISLRNTNLNICLTASFINILLLKLQIYILPDNVKLLTDFF